MASNKIGIKIKDRKENGIELRKTHFMLGTDGKKNLKLGKSYDSQYRRDYLPHSVMADQANMDSVTLRKTHFKFGDYKTPYSTSLMDQNRNIENGRARSVIASDQSQKKDRTQSHFILGNSDSSYTTVFRTEYYNKGLNNKDNPLNSKAIEKTLRSHNYVLGNDVPDYKSETQAKYVLPQGYTVQNEKKISTAELQKSHYIFGTNDSQWATTSNSSYVPKYINNQKVVKDLTKHNLVLGEHRNDFKSVHHETYIPHQLVKSNENKGLSQDLRNHHFVFGNDTGDEGMVSMQQKDFVDHSKNLAKKPLDSKSLRVSHFTLGDKSQEPLDQYETTYGSTMKHQTRGKENTINNKNWTSNIMMNSDTKNSYNTETRSNYGYKLNPISEKEIKQMKGVINDIRGHHFNLGETKNDYGTTFENTFKYDSHSANQAKGVLDSSIKSDLKSSHYKLGYLPNDSMTTHQATYVPMALQAKVNHDPKLRQSSFQINSGYRNNFDSKTIYMIDYTKKELE